MLRIGLTAILLACFGVAATSIKSDLGLIEAIKNQDGPTLDSLLGRHADVNVKQPDGATPLAWAVYLNQMDTVERLMKAGANVNTADQYGETPLTLACATGNGAIIEKLINAGADANAARWNGETALMIAARSGSVDGVKLLLAHGAKVDAVESHKGQNALMWAAAAGHPDVVDLLIKTGADAKAASKGGFTPLVFAAQKGDAKSVASLLAAGADPNSTLPNHMSVLQVAALGGKNKAAEALLDKGANVDVADSSGLTPLHVSAQTGNLALVKDLLAKHANPNLQTAKISGGGRSGGQGGFRRPAGEQTPLLLAARANHEDAMRALVAAGADPKLKAQDGTSLLMAAASSGHIEIVKYAYELSPDVAAVTDRKSTVMHAAVTGSMLTSTQPEICKVIQFLADKGADPDGLDANGRTPIAIANILPIDKGVELLVQLIERDGKTPKISPKR